MCTSGRSTIHPCRHPIVLLWHPPQPQALQLPTQHAPSTVQTEDVGIQHRAEEFEMQVYDLRPDTSTSAALTLARNGGCCTFCAAPLPAAAAAAAAAATSRSSSCSGEGVSEAAAAGDAAAEASTEALAERERALEFTLRLVEYDRTAAVRSAVVDDQGDYFEIDSNAWLTVEERENLRAQQAVVAELEHQRRSKVTVSVDLIGREVRCAPRL
jgi:hypothetical protein